MKQYIIVYLYVSGRREADEAEDEGHQEAVREAAYLRDVVCFGLFVYDFFVEYLVVLVVLCV